MVWGVETSFRWSPQNPCREFLIPRFNEFATLQTVHARSISSLGSDSSDNSHFTDNAAFVATNGEPSLYPDGHNNLANIDPEFMCDIAQIIAIAAADRQPKQFCSVKA